MIILRLVYPTKNMSWWFWDMQVFKNRAENKQIFPVTFPILISNWLRLKNLFSNSNQNMLLVVFSCHSFSVWIDAMCVCFDCGFGVVRFHLRKNLLTVHVTELLFTRMLYSNFGYNDVNNSFWLIHEYVLSTCIYHWFALHITCTMVAT